MAFYKLDNEEILEAPNGVYTPTNTMTIDNYKDFNYPVEGWYWFDTFDEALVFFANKSKDSITMRQARLYLLELGLLSQVDSIVSQNEAWRIEWEYATEVLKDSPLVSALAGQLGLSQEQLDTMFNEASKL